MAETKESPYIICDKCKAPIYTAYWTDVDNWIITHTCNKCHYIEKGE